MGSVAGRVNGRIRHRLEMRTNPVTVRPQTIRAMLNCATTAATKWSSLPTSFYRGSITDIRRHIPRVRHLRIARWPQDMVVALTGAEQPPVPLALVSKRYVFVDHRAVVDAVVDALRNADIDPDAVHAELCTTAHGERMAISVTLPDEYSFDPGDGHTIALRFECLNSVDGSTGFRALLGWYRHVCANGLIVGITQHDLRARHYGAFEVKDVGAVLRTGLAQADTERVQLQDWRRRRVDPARVAAWVNGPLWRTWGFKAAARAWHVIETGGDAEIAGTFRGVTPTTIATTAANAVPGAPATSRNLFDVSQALAWVARQRRDVVEQITWREQIPDLLEQL